MAFLYRVRKGGRSVARALARPLARSWETGLLLAGVLVGCSACERPDAEFVPDAVLQRELGLAESDRVHTVRITGGGSETAHPALDSVAIGGYVQFVTDDWLVHEVRFELDHLMPEARAFLERTDQTASPPLLQRDSRFVVSFDGAPPGLYRYVLEGNGRPGSGEIVVVDSTPR